MTRGKCYAILIFTVVIDPFDYTIQHGIQASDLQLDAVRILLRERGGVAWWRAGEGKTRIALLAFLCWPLQSETSQLCVFARPEVFFDWQNEARKIGMDPTRLQMRSFAKLQRQGWEREAEDVMRDGRIGMVCFDELYLYKNPRAQRSEAAAKIATRKPCIGLSGSIMTARDITDIYGQAKSVGKGKRIADSLTNFRSVYMTGINEHGTTKHYPTKGAYHALMSICTGFCHVWMPKQSERTIHESNILVDETSHQRELFEEMRETMTLQDYGLEINNAMAYMVKLQQISDGFVVDGDKRPNPISSHKVAATIAKIEELLAEGGKVIVWCAFRYDVEMLRLAGAGKFNALTMMGGEPFDLPKWQTGKWPVVFATEASGSGVNHFKDVPYAIYFSMSSKWLDFQQSRARTDRKDSAHDTCYYYHVHVRNTLDENILRRVRQAGSSESAMLRLAADMQAWLKGKPLDAAVY